MNDNLQQKIKELQTEIDMAKTKLKSNIDKVDIPTLTNSSIYTNTNSQSNFDLGKMLIRQSIKFFAKNNSPAGIIFKVINSNLK